MPHYLDEPYVLQVVQIELAQDLLRVLAHHEMSPLPERHRAICARMVLRLTQMRRELEQAAEQVAEERYAEDHRGNT